VGASPLMSLCPMKNNKLKAPRNAKTAMKKGFLSNKIKELKKNKTKDSS